MGKVGHLEADVMHAAIGVLGKELRDGGVLTELRHQLDLTILERHEHNGDTVLGQLARMMHVGAEQVAIARRGGREIWHDDGDVIEPADHLLESLPSISLSTLNAASSTLVPGPKISATPAARRKA